MEGFKRLKKEEACLKSTAIETFYFGAKMGVHMHCCGASCCG